MNYLLYTVGGAAWLSSAALLAVAWSAAVEDSPTSGPTLNLCALLFLIGLLAVALGRIVGLLLRIAAAGERAPARTPPPAPAAAPPPWPE